MKIIWEMDTMVVSGRSGLRNTQDCYFKVLGKHLRLRNLLHLLSWFVVCMGMQRQGNTKKRVLIDLMPGHEVDWKVDVGLAMDQGGA